MVKAEETRRIKAKNLAFKEPKQGIYAPVCRKWPSGTDEAGQKGKIMIKDYQLPSEQDRPVSLCRTNEDTAVAGSADIKRGIEKYGIPSKCIIPRVISSSNQSGGS